MDFGQRGLSKLILRLLNKPTNAYTLGRQIPQATCCRCHEGRGRKAEVGYNYCPEKIDPLVLLVDVLHNHTSSILIF
jgi:hypothetical protein